ncbi:MAG: type II secretion system protein [Magnetococcales bacterium]|nr:type II secretion system protein [Magnetococcales bacterium]MBF0323284.1 type II secretion system protein [Magnetococcales bacterium]
MKKHPSAGFSLIELSIVMVIVGLILAIGFSLVPNYLQSSKVSAARVQMKEIQSAIEGFAIANNRLPCPDTDSDGLENITSNVCVAFGNTAGTRYDTADLPYRALGLASNRDPWGRAIKYATYMMRTVTGGCTNAASCDFATDQNFAGTSTTRSRSDFCSKLTTALQLTPRDPTKEIFTARLQSRSGLNADSICTSGVGGTVMDGSVMAYILASSGFNNANQDTSPALSAGVFDGKNDPGNSLCFDNPDRVLRSMDASDESSSTDPTYGAVGISDNYDDIVFGGSISGLISKLECN